MMESEEVSDAVREERMIENAEVSDATREGR